MRLLLLSLLFFAGCATPPANDPDEVRTNAAVKERYWRIQSAQRSAPARSVTVRLPERVEDGARRVSTLTEIRLP